jgi:hypothetical protein
MQARQVKEVFGQVGQAIGKASQLCQTSNKVPEPLRESIDALSRESEQARQKLATEQNDNRIIECVDRLEKLGDRAWHACSMAGNTVDEQVRTAVKQAHDALSDLKHRLH